MDHLLAGDAVIATMERQPSLETDGILDSLLRLPNDTAARQALRTANIALTRRSIRESVTPGAQLIHAITAVEELDKSINSAAKRVRAWYALHDPELEHRIADHATFINALLDQPARSADTMGGSTTPLVLAHARAVNSLIAHRTALAEGIDAAMTQVAPNIKRVAGAMIGAKLIAIAGSLERLAIMPAGTIQLLGAETALFRHLRNPAARPPKHGVIFNHQAIQHARPQDRGKIARTLADAIAIAARVDRFKGSFVGDDLARRVERRSAEIGRRSSA